MINAIEYQAIEVSSNALPLTLGKQNQSRPKETSSDTASVHTNRLMKYQKDSQARPPQKPQSIYLKLSDQEKDLLEGNNNLAYYNVSKTKGINKTAIGNEYGASQKVLKIFPDNIDTRLGIGDMLFNDDSILLTDSNLINDMIANNIIDSKELSNAKLTFNEWNLKIMSSTKSKKGSLLQNTSNPKNKLNEIIANVTPFDSNPQPNQLPMPIPIPLTNQTIAITDEGKNYNSNSNSSRYQAMVTSTNDSKVIKKPTTKPIKSKKKRTEPKASKKAHNYSFHNESTSGRTTLNSNSNSHRNNHLLPKSKDPFKGNPYSEGAKKNNRKEHQLKSKETKEPKGKITILSYLKILFGDQLELFNENALQEKLDDPNLKDMFRQLSFHALNQENVIKELTVKNKKMEKELKEKNKKVFELSTQMTEIKSNLIGCKSSFLIVDSD